MTSTLSHTVTGARRDRVAYLNHPMGAEGSFWDAFTAEIGEELATIAPDQYGAGRSAEITGPVSLERHVQDMEQLRRHLGVERMIVVGCAIGGMIGASYAALYPQHVSALVMTNPGLKTRNAKA